MVEIREEKRASVKIHQDPINKLLLIQI